MENKILHINHLNQVKSSKINLPASKSVANRALLINALAGEGSELHNISEARDTQTMQRLLASEDSTWDVLDAGTTMRFLTAYSALLPGTKTLTGTARMQERPIKLLTDALAKLGAKISYHNNEGYPPHDVTGISAQLTDKLEIPGNVSSQYISALLMIAPMLPNGLSLTLTGEIGSKPYIQMTLSVMKAFGVTADWNGNIISISPQKYKPCSYTIEPDWSAASYWYSFVALSNEETEITLVNLVDDSIQGDRKIADIMDELGVNTEFTKEGAVLTKKKHNSTSTIDFTHCPDLAQTVAVVCAIKGITCKMTGLESLRIKETDRIAALQNEMSKFGADLIEDKATWTVKPGKIKNEELEFETYHDHRMAMAFAPLATQTKVTIKDPSVVNKSYPRYWEDLEKAGFIIS